MNKSTYVGAVVLTLAFTLIYASVANAQNATTNASNAMGNASAKANNTMANASAKANNTMGNASAKAGEAAANIANKTEDLGKKIAGGLGSLLGNASQKLKEGSK
jgi:predicted 2-oxoglutarate/Fe(II)-dependent dioxygenase YbiX